MHLFVLIPCKDEATTLPRVLEGIPRAIPGVSRISVLVVDDGSVDGTADVAVAHGADHVIRFATNRGLARAFAVGMDRCLELGADLIVGTDGDNQYKSSQISDLLAPILRGEADLVVGDRGVASNPHFAFLKRLLERMGSLVVGVAAGRRIPDAVSGFRAYSREAALALNVSTTHSYSVDTLLQAVRKGLALKFVPVETNATERKSRLAPSTAIYIRRQAATALRLYYIYQPLRLFAAAGALMVAAGAALGIRFLVLFLTRGGTGNVQSLILAAILIVVGFQVVLTGVLADLTATNRKLIEDLLARQRDSRKPHPGQGEGGSGPGEAPG